MIKEFYGKDLEEVIKEIDNWMIENNGSFYGSKPIKKTILTDGSYELKVNIKI